MPLHPTREIAKRILDTCPHERIGNVAYEWLTGRISGALTLERERSQSLRAEVGRELHKCIGAIEALSQVDSPDMTEPAQPDTQPIGPMSSEVVLHTSEDDVEAARSMMAWLKRMVGR